MVWAKDYHSWAFWKESISKREGNDGCSPVDHGQYRKSVPRLSKNGRIPDYQKELYS
jgi:hypothetical protein